MKKAVIIRRVSKKTKKVEYWDPKKRKIRYHIKKTKRIYYYNKTTHRYSSKKAWSKYRTLLRRPAKKVVRRYKRITIEKGVKTPSVQDKFPGYPDDKEKHARYTKLVLTFRVDYPSWQGEIRFNLNLGKAKTPADIDKFLRDPKNRKRLYRRLSKNNKSLKSAQLIKIEAEVKFHTRQYIRRSNT